MVTYPKHEFTEDPKKASALCTVCKQPKRAGIHSVMHIRGTAKPTKLG